MANTKSALKAWRQSLGRRLRNRARRSAVKTQIGKAEGLLSAGQVETAAAAVRGAVSALDRAAERGVIHPNNAARRKSRLLKKYNVAQAQAQGAAVTREVEEPAPRRRRTRKGEAEEPQPTPRPSRARTRKSEA